MQDEFGLVLATPVSTPLSIFCVTLRLSTNDQIRAAAGPVARPRLMPHRKRLHRLTEKEFTRPSLRFHLARNGAAIPSGLIPNASHARVRSTDAVCERTGRRCDALGSVAGIAAPCEPMESNEVW